MRSSSFEDKDRSITGAFSEDPPNSNSGEQGRRKEISNGDPDGGGDTDGTDGGGLSCPQSLATREQERRNLKASGKEKRTAR
jgi:hypothetical protein